MKVGFVVNSIDNRGTGNSTFLYAHYNELLLDNKSQIFTLDLAARNPIMEKLLIDRFGKIKIVPDKDDMPDVLYHIKSGEVDNFKGIPGIPYLVHAVFRIQPHGDRYAAVSNWLANGKVPFVPHIVHPAFSKRDYKKKLGIGSPYDGSFIIGRHGGWDTFDISWVWDAISESLDRHPKLHFVFMNTMEQAQHPRVHYLPEGGPLEKRAFLNTCDAMLHARTRGETFGISVGEFAYYGLPVMTYNGSGERAHIQELGDEALLYDTPEDIVKHIDDLVSGEKSWPRYAYDKYEPKDVMPIFKEVFLDD